MRFMDISIILTMPMTVPRFSRGLYSAKAPTSSTAAFTISSEPFIASHADAKMMMPAVMRSTARNQKLPKMKFFSRLSSCFECSEKTLPISFFAEPAFGNSLYTVMPSRYSRTLLLVFIWLSFSFSTTTLEVFCCELIIATDISAPTINAAPMRRSKNSMQIVSVSTLITLFMLFSRIFEAFCSMKWISSVSVVMVSPILLEEKKPIETFLRWSPISQRVSAAAS